MTVLEFDDFEALSAHAAAMAREAALAAVAARGVCTMVLSGGSTPRRTYEIMAADEAFPWNETHFFFSDERDVSAEHPDSNWRMAREALLDKAPVPKDNVHPIRMGGFGTGIDAVGHEQHLRTFFTRHKLDERGGCPFDFVFLGMGADGHTASLFPGDDALKARRQFVHTVPAGLGEPPCERVTLTLGILNMARNVVFMIQGADKRAVLRAIEADPEAAGDTYPAALVAPRGPLTWLVAG